MPRTEKSWINELSKPSASKEMASVDPAFFAWHYLGFTVPPHQKVWYGFYQNRRHLHLSPREHGKSIVFTCVSPLWHLLHIPNYRILLTSKTYSLSTQFLDVIEAHLTKNQKIQQDYGKEVSSFVRKANQIWCNREDYGIKEPSITAIGRGNAVTSGHYEYHIMDDIIDDDSVRSQQSREFLITWHQGTIGGVLAPNAKEHIIGTRKHPQDFYNHIMELGTYSITREQAIIKYPKKYEYIYEEQEGYRQAVDVDIEGDYEILWEDEDCAYAWDIKKLLLKKMEMGLLFEREYQNNTAVLEGTILKPEWLHYYTTDPKKAHGEIVLKPPGFKWSIQGWDLAISTKEGADYTVCCTIHVSKDNRCYVSFFRGKWDAPTVLKLIEKMYLQTYPLPSAVGIESVSLGKAYLQMTEHRTIIPTVEVKQTRDKVMRLSALAPFFENGTIMIDVNDRAFFSEYVEFPTSAHDDMLDALEIAMRCLLKRRKRTTKIPG